MVEHAGSRERRRDAAWTPAVGDRCEGRWRAAQDGQSRRKAWFPGEVVGEEPGGLYCVRYDDGDEEDGVGTTADVLLTHTSAASWHVRTSAQNRSTRHSMRCSISFIHKILGYS